MPIIEWDVLVDTQEAVEVRFVEDQGVSTINTFMKWS
jgi:hypothetical protein